MVANLILKSDGYHCSNCMMRQSQYPAWCYFCGCEFTNWEEVAYKEVMKEVEEEYNDEESTYLDDYSLYTDYINSRRRI